jgi:hypothetical protein
MQVHAQTVMRAFQSCHPVAGPTQRTFQSESVLRVALGMAMMSWTAVLVL